MQRKNTVDNNPITLTNLGKCRGKPNEREREILLLCFRKVQNNNKSTFPAKENTSQHQIYHTEICLVFCKKTVLLYGLPNTLFSMPTVNCTDCSVRPKIATKSLKSASKNVPKIASIFVPNLYGCT